MSHRSTFRLAAIAFAGMASPVLAQEEANEDDLSPAGGSIVEDANSAHGGYVLDPGISYRTPLSRGTIIGLSAGAQYGGGGFNDYYYSVTPQQSAASGLPQFEADEGWYKAGGSLSFGLDLDGDFQNGGFVVGLLASYSRMLGDAAASPYTSIRGDADQFSAAAGVGFIF